ncbi:hypothetical protein QE382_002545 [Sphingobacterium zeae]|uniref:Uncharacterized protein n=1 Tax=Sphingobacterium zeae TaxID=1776859 RepID=A0ABU0U6I0_9SPHI|nr:hypothetical protein [Sphingobacterium zeae]
MFCNPSKKNKKSPRMMEILTDYLGTKGDHKR